MTKLGGSLDTNVVLRLLLNDVPKQHKAAVDLFNGNDAQFAIADTAIIEVVFVLCRAYEFSRKQAAEAVEGLMTLKEINCNRNLLMKALSLFVEHPALSLEDCCLAIYAQINGAEPLWTFDKKLASQAFSTRLIKS